MLALNVVLILPTKAAVCLATLAAGLLADKENVCLFMNTNARIAVKPMK
jgi:hypothetical protein